MFYLLTRLDSLFEEVLLGSEVFALVDDAVQVHFKEAGEFVVHVFEPGFQVYFSPGDLILCLLVFSGKFRHPFIIDGFGERHVGDGLADLSGEEFLPDIGLGARAALFAAMVVVVALLDLGCVGAPAGRTGCKPDEWKIVYTLFVGFAFATQVLLDGVEEFLGDEGFVLALKKLPLETQEAVVQRVGQ